MIRGRALYHACKNKINFMALVSAHISALHHMQYGWLVGWHCSGCHHQGCGPHFQHHYYLTGRWKTISLETQTLCKCNELVMSHSSS